MKEEMDEIILVMGAFTLCPRTEQTVLANYCLDCDYINEKDGQYTCVYDESSDADNIRIVDVINMLLELVEGGKTRIKKSGLAALINPDND